ncbi:MAG: peptide MFS transporter [Terriglobia bacterium]
MALSTSLNQKPNIQPAEKHPKGLVVLFAVEMWERFGFYTISSTLALYLRDPTRGLGWSEASVVTLVSYFLMLVYASPLIGGWIADKVLGYRFAITIGGVLLGVGYFLLYFPPVTLLYLGLALIVIGNGFFKPNVSTLVGNLYEEGSSLKDSAYNIFYMGINTGAFMAPLVAEFVQQRLGFRAAFSGAGFGMIVSLLIFWSFRRWVEAKGTRTSYAQTEGSGAGSLSGKDSIEAVPDSWRVAALLVIFAIVIVFWMLFYQSTLTLIYFANDHTNWAAIGNVSGVLSAAINPFWIITLTFPLIAFWGWLDRRGLEPSTPAKMALGMSLIGGAFYLMALASFSGGNAGRVSPWWLIAAYGIVSLGELMLSPMGLSLVSKVAPSRMRGLMMGAWFVALALGGKLTAIGVYWTVWSHSTFFAILASMAMAMALLLWIVLKPLKKAMPGV